MTAGPQRPIPSTAISLSVLGMGTGGVERLGQHRRMRQPAVDRLIERAIDLGITYFDTAPVYGDSERRLGRALRTVGGASIVVGSKYSPLDAAGRLISPLEVRRQLEASLRRLGVERVGLYSVHAPRLGDLDRIVVEHGPVLRRAQDAGLIGAVGLAESYGTDHAVAAQAMQSGLFDVVMLGYNLLNQTAAHSVLPAALDKVAIVVIAPLRGPLAAAASLRALSAELTEEPVATSTTPWPTGLERGDVKSIAYRFAASHPAITSVLTGTVDLDHLATNASAMRAGDLAPSELAFLQAHFGRFALDD